MCFTFLSADECVALDLATVPILDNLSLNILCSLSRLTDKDKYGEESIEFIWFFAFAYMMV